jgi:hypothetical protein
VGEGVKDVFTQILHARVPIPSEKAADLPPTFDAWWARASARDASQRYQTAKEFAEALNLSLRISEVLEIGSLIPRAEVSSAGRISILAGSLNALGTAQQISSGPTLAIPQDTLDETYSRTFEPEPMFRKRRLRLYAGLGGAMALMAALVFSRTGGQTAPMPEHAVAAATAPAPMPPAPISPPPVTAPLTTAHAEHVEPKAMGAPRGRTPTRSTESTRAAPHKTAKPKAATASRPADDFGI